MPRTPFSARCAGSSFDVLRPNPSRSRPGPREQVVPESLGRLGRAPVKEPSLGHAFGIRSRVSLPRRARDLLAQILHATRRRLPSTGDLLVSACAVPRNPATVLAALPPASRLRAPLAVATPVALAQGSVSSARRPSTSAITTVREHDSGRDLPPRKPRRDCSLRGVTRAAALALRRAAGRAFSGPGAVVRLAAPPAPPLGEGSFAPTPMSSGTSCHRARVRTGRRACTDERDRGPHEPAGGRRKRRPLEGCFSPPSAKKGWMGAPEVPSVERPPRRAVRKDSTACDQPVGYLRRRLFYRRDILRR